MKISQAFKMALSAVLGNKVRSFLTMLGVIIGVIAVSLLITLGQSAGNSITGQISELGSNMLIVNVRTRKNYSITMDDIAEMVGENGLSAASPYVSASGVTVKSSMGDHSTTVGGATPMYDEMRSYKVQFGRAISDEDVEKRANVAVVGVDVCDELFGEGNYDVLGESITMLGRRFTIIGVLESKGSSIMGSQDDMIEIPLTTAQRVLKQNKLSTFYFSAASAEEVPAAKEYVEKYFHNKLKVGQDEDSDYYSVFDQSQLLDTVDTAMGTITAMLGGIAGISLLVGGIGIMNIMLVSVTERTREIGIRKAIGAKRRYILTQFLIESSFISLTGGLIGLGLAMGAGVLITNLISLEMTFTVSTIILALGFSIIVGVFFGMYPANKASKLHPIEALRHE